MHSISILGVSNLQETSFSGPKTVTRKVSTTSAKNLTTVTVIQPDERTSSSRLASNGSGDEMSPWHVTSGAAPPLVPRKTPARRISAAEQRRVITTELWCVCLSRGMNWVVCWMAVQSTDGTDQQTGYAVADFWGSAMLSHDNGSEFAGENKQPCHHDGVIMHLPISLAERTSRWLCSRLMELVQYRRRFVRQCCAFTC